MSEKPVVLSLGAGVQSTTLALMAAHGEFDKTPDLAIFADTGWEPKAVYDQLQWLQSPNVLPFPVQIVSAGNIKDHLTTNTTGKRFASIPWFTKNGGMGLRQCTREYKIEPIAKALRRYLGYEPRKHIPVDSIEVWIGISTDEMQRMSRARNKWQTNRFPLFEKGMSRQDCYRWMDKNDYPTPPKSSCIGCPFHKDAMWRDMKINDPISFAEAVETDLLLRKHGPRKQMDNLEFMHRSLKPLGEVDFRNLEDLGQQNMFEPVECEGVCGL